MSRADEAAFVRGPKKGKVMKYGMTTTHAVFKTPNEWLGQKVSFSAEGANAHVLFGSAITIEVSGIGLSTKNTTTKILTVNTTTGGFIPENGIRDFDVESDGSMAYFAVEGSADGYWIGYPSGKF
jgi:hypothetical protein